MVTPPPTPIAPSPKTGTRLHFQVVYAIQLHVID